MPAIHLNDLLDRVQDRLDHVLDRVDGHLPGSACDLPDLPSLPELPNPGDLPHVPDWLLG